ncbi:hypothetical protein PAXINDRAFT_110644 [Paxillus involutus ATCC 200175]|nr:hypothetical protein PAXINDRAFT_110644 [Paxillus involutus ATCC 200175]
MPGPCNTKRKKKCQSSRDKKVPSSRTSLDSQTDDQTTPPPLYEPDPPQPLNLDHLNDLCPEYDAYHPHEPPDSCDPPPDNLGAESPLTAPNIYDPGNGPRVRNACAFLSSFFSQPPAMDDPMCAEFAQEEILQMLRTVLPEETAIILWYNKSRSIGRVCPSCRRLYNLGDVLPNLAQEGAKHYSEPQSPYLSREQEISGLCSPLCFIMACFNHPTAIKTTWGRVAGEMDDYTWDLLNGPGVGAGDKALSLLMKMTRLSDLGLGQLCLPDIDFDSEVRE